MLDKIAITIKDLVTYLIPGILTLISLIYLAPIDLKKIGMIDNANLPLLSVIFSLPLGFIVGQVQIFLFYEMVPKAKPLKLSDCSMPIEYKDKVAEKIKIVFDLNPDLDIQNILDAPKILSLCDNYVRIKGSSESYSQIERDSYWSSFSIVVFLPTMLVLISCIKSLKFCFYCWETILFILAFGSILFCIITKAATNFNRGKLCKTFEQFLIYSLKAETSKNSG